MRRGKEIAQGAHASMEFLVEQVRAELQTSGSQVNLELTVAERTWLLHGMAKVCLQVNSEAELLEFHKQAEGSGLKSYLIQDSGRTEFHGEATFTACAIGPDESEKIDAITGDLVPY